MMGKVESGRQTTMALSIRDGEDDVVFKGSHMVQFFVVSSTICYFWQGLYILCVCGGFANKKESHTYDSVYYLCGEKTTVNTLNITLFWENILVPLYGCILAFTEIQHWLYFQNNVAVVGFCITLCMSGYIER
jgi:hypothetical protein